MAKNKSNKNKDEIEIEFSSSSPLVSSLSFSSSISAVRSVECGLSWKERNELLLITTSSILFSLYILHSTVYNLQCTTFLYIGALCTGVGGFAVSNETATWLRAKAKMENFSRGEK